MSLFRAARIRTFLSPRPSRALATVVLLPVGKVPTNSRYCWSPRMRLSASALNLTILGSTRRGGPQDEVVGVGIELDDSGVHTPWCPSSSHAQDTANA